MSEALMQLHDELESPEHRGLACFEDPVRAEVSKHERRRRAFARSTAG